MVMRNDALDGKKSDKCARWKEERHDTILACTTVIGNWGDKVRVRAMPSAANPNNPICARMD